MYLVRAICNSKGCGRSLRANGHNISKCVQHRLVAIFFGADTVAIGTVSGIRDKALRWRRKEQCADGPTWENPGVRAIERIREAIRQQRSRISSHANEEMSDGDLEAVDVEQIILTGDIARRYTRDPRGTWYEVVGRTTDSRRGAVRGSGQAAPFAPWSRTVGREDGCSATTNAVGDCDRT